MSAKAPRALRTSAIAARAARPDQVVGVLALGQQREAQALARADQRQRRLDRAKRRLASRVVAVEAQDRLGRHRPEQRALIGGQRRAERRDDVGEARLAHRDDVDIAFDDDDLAALVRGLAGAMVVEKQRALVEELGLRRIEVFRLGARLHRPAAEGDDPAGAVVDREHHPVAEAVVGHGDPLAVNKQAGLDHLIGADALGGQRVAQREALGRGVAERKALLRRGSEPAIGEIAARLRADRLVQIGLEDAAAIASTSRRVARFVSCSASAPLWRGIGTPAIAASRSTASGKLRPSVSIRKVKMSPCLPDEKSW